MTDWRAIGGEASSRIGKFLRWWGRELAACLPDKVLHFFQPPRTKLLIEIQKEGALQLTKESPAGDEPPVTIEPRGDVVAPEDAERLDSLIGGVDSVVLVLPESCGVRRRVDLPAAARENLREVLTIEMDRLTPFKADDIYFAYAPPVAGRSKEQIGVDLTIVPKTLADDVLRMANSLGIKPDILALGADASQDVNLLSPAATTSLQRFKPLMGKAFAAAVGLLAIAAIMIPFDKQAHVLGALEAQIAKAGPGSTQAARIEQQLAAWREGAERISAFRTENPAATVVLNELSSTVPKGTWLTDVELTLAPSRIVVAGFSNNAPGLIAPLEALDTLQGVKFEEPVSFDDRQSRDRFRLSADVVAASAPARP